MLGAATTLSPAAAVFATLGFGWPGFAAVAPGLGVDVSVGVFAAPGFGIGGSAEFELGGTERLGDLGGYPSLRLAGLIHPVVSVGPVTISADGSLGMSARRPLSVGYWVVDDEVQWRYASARLDFVILGRTPPTAGTGPDFQLGPWLRMDAEFLPVLEVLHRDGGEDESTGVARLRCARVMGGLQMGWSGKDGPSVDFRMAVGAIRFPNTTGVDFVARLGFTFQRRS